MCFLRCHAQNTITKWHSRLLHCEASLTCLFFYGGGVDGVWWASSPHVIKWWLLGDHPGKEPFICGPALPQSGSEPSCTSEPTAAVQITSLTHIRLPWGFQGHLTQKWHESCIWRETIFFLQDTRSRSVERTEDLRFITEAQQRGPQIDRIKGCVLSSN